MKKNFKHSQSLSVKRLLIIFLVSFSLLIPLSREALAHSVDTRYVNETSWKVGEFQNVSGYTCYGSINAVPWVFHRNGTMDSGNSWRGSWRSLSRNKIEATIQFPNRTTDSFDIVFLSSGQFIAMKGTIYRYGLIE